MREQSETGAFIKSSFDGFLQEGYLLANPPELQRLCISAYRLLAQGNPVSPDALTEAASLRLDETHALISLIPESAYTRRSDGALTAFIGLSIEKSAHRFIVGGRTLYVWCVFDALFLPALLKCNAILKTRCPATHADIIIDIDSERAAPVSPTHPVMSIIAPDNAACCRDLRGAFCDHVNFFADQDAFNRANVDGACVSLDEAFALATRRNAARFPDVDPGDI